ncbi:hypothetical protein BDW68DRAFT_146982 [Aspergillus falconensis]
MLYVTAWYCSPHLALEIDIRTRESLQSNIAILTKEKTMLLCVHDLHQCNVTRWKSCQNIYALCFIAEKRLGVYVGKVALVVLIVLSPLMSVFRIAPRAEQSSTHGTA